ncbi:glycosyltransferase family 4 protein [Gillisia limnaea]|uniref:Glycosyl transferase group 1 n=1 Tax=Gillisia limnaea (strain DSM 15749 / LMG 21470 / R-8282) TaxID=865937 RepID=H2BUR6_GILLR|nr:glycosyltransferase family 4 protein [Gillisia limnaea]EHQ01721.1 glycosyl transferase group 1 [Gillisia limnaea DSM 15749]
MKNRLLYIGNKLSDKRSNPTAHNALKKGLQKEGFKTYSVSHFKNKYLRLGHMAGAFFWHFRRVELVLIDVYSTQNFWYAVVISRLAKLFQKKYVPILHGGDLKNRFMRSPEAIRKLFGNAYMVISPSLYLKEEVEKLGFPNVRYLPNPLYIDTYRFKTRKVLRPELLWVRAFDKIYNPMLALQTLEILLKDHPEAVLKMVGPDKDGSLSNCRKYAGERNLPVTFTGKLKKQQWKVLASNCDIFLNTTHIDNTPVSVIEAMALGLPVVSTNVGGIPFLIEAGRTGMLVPPNNAEAMAKAVEYLMNNPEAAHAIATNARETAENFDWELIKHKWKELLS